MARCDRRTIPTASMWQWRTFEAATYESGILGYLDSHDSIWLARWSSDEEAFVKLRATNHVQTMRRTLQQDEIEFELYRFDRLPDATLTVFENGMRLHRVEIQNGQVDLWWSADAAIEANYTVSVKVLDSAGQVIAQIDRQPQLDLRPTSTWQADELIYDPYKFDIEGASVLIQVYLWTPETIQPILTTTGENGLTLAASD